MNLNNFSSIRTRAFRLASSLLICLVTVHFGASRSLAKETWINLQSTNFNMVSNASETETRKLALKLEQFRDAFTKIFNLRAVVSQPMTVIVFKDDGSFKPFKPLYNGKPANVAGYFQRAENESIIALNINGNELHPLSVIFHEYVHFLTGYEKRPFPAWLNEGLAEFYSTFESTDDKVNLGVAVDNHVRLLRANSLIPLHDLFGVTTKSSEYNERSKQGIFYAESWALMHYLRLGDNGVHLPQLVQFTKLYLSGMDTDKAFSTAFGGDYKTLETALKAYVRNDSFKFISYDLKISAAQREMTVRPITEAETRFYEGTLLLDIGRIDDAVELFKQSGTLDPTSPRSYEGLGFAEIKRGNHAQAVPLFTQAIERKSQNDLVYYYSAEGLWRDGGMDQSKPEKSALIVADLKQAIKLNPSRAKSHYLLGEAYLFAGDHFEEGVQDESTAMRLDPANANRYALILGQLQLRLGKKDEARSTLQPLTAADIAPELREPAERILERVDGRAQNAGAAGGQVTEDQRALGAVTPPDPDQKPDRPTLTRQGRGGQQDQVKPSSPDSGTTDPTHNPVPAGVTEANSPRTISGLIVSIECSGDEAFLVLQTSDKQLLRFSIRDLSTLRVFPIEEGSKKIGCGPINRKAAVHAKPSAAGIANAGQVVLIEMQD